MKELEGLCWLCGRGTSSSGCSRGRVTVRKNRSNPALVKGGNDTLDLACLIKVQRECPAGPECKVKVVAVHFSCYMDMDA